MIPDLGPLIIMWAIIVFISVPLALWKLIEIIIWIFNHVHFI